MSKKQKQIKKRKQKKQQKQLVQQQINNPNIQVPVQPQPKQQPKTQKIKAKENVIIESQIAGFQPQNQNVHQTEQQQKFAQKSLKPGLKQELNILKVLQQARLSLFLNDVQEFREISEIFLDKLDEYYEVEQQFKKNQKNLSKNVEKQQKQLNFGLTENHQKLLKNKISLETIQAEIEILVKFNQSTQKNTKKMTKQKRIQLIITIDEIFYKIYYHQKEQALKKQKLILEKTYLSAQQQKEQIEEQELEDYHFTISPLDFLKGSCCEKLQEVEFEKFLEELKKLKCQKKFIKLYQFDGEISVIENELLCLLQQRIKETIQLFYNDVGFQKLDFIQLGDIFQEFSQGVGKEYGQGPNGPPIAYTLLQQWRNNIRDWSCWMYSYSVLNDTNVKAITQNLSTRVIEAGAGTGYIANQLKIAKGNLQIEAFDLYPTNEFSGKNQYHRNSPQFIEVKQGGAEILKQKQYENHDLLLSYPPPNSNMALETLQNFKGEKFAYIGEWRGVTATNQFEVYLQLNFSLICQQKIPTFPDQTCDLTIWERRDKPLLHISDIDEDDHLYRCSNCKKVVDQNTQLYKCMFCRQNYYCSQKCLEEDEKNHTYVHKIRGIYADYSKLQINNTSQFAKVSQIKVQKSIQDFIRKKIEEDEEKSSSSSSSSSEEEESSSSESEESSSESESDSDSDSESPKKKKKVKKN